MLSFHVLIIPTVLPRKKKNSDCLYGSAAVLESSPSPACVVWRLCRSHLIVNESVCFKGHCYWVQFKAGRVRFLSNRQKKTEKGNRNGDKKQILTRTQIEEEEIPTFKILFTRKILVTQKVLFTNNKHRLTEENQGKIMYDGFNCLSLCFGGGIAYKIFKT